MSVLQRVLARPLLWWALAAVWLVRDAYGNLLTPNRPDGQAQIQASARWLHHPYDLYTSAASSLTKTGMVPVDGYIKPPAAAMFGAPFTLFGPDWAVRIWTLSDALAAIVALALVQRHIARSPLEKAVFWAVALYFPPLYAEVNAGQIGGFLLLFACAGMVVFPKRPGFSGALVAAAASLKLYPALMIIGARQQWRPFLTMAITVGVVINVIASIPLGISGGPSYFYVLALSLQAPNPDCAQTSVATLFGRSIGGDPYPIINPNGSIAMLQSPIHLHAVAFVLTALTLLAVLAAAVIAARASGWNPFYGMALGLALGGIVPGEINPYQYLPLLPLVLLVLVVTLRRKRWAHVAVIAAGLLLWLRQPCLLPFPNLWTVGALIVFTVCVLAAREFRTDS